MNHTGYAARKAICIKYPIILSSGHPLMSQNLLGAYLSSKMASYLPNIVLY